MARYVLIDGQPILSLQLSCLRMHENSTDEECSEYVCLVDWVKTVPRYEAKRRSTPRLYTTTHVRASLDGQPETVKFLEREFGVSLRDLIT